MAAASNSRLKIIFAGTPEFATVALAVLLESPHEICAVLTQPDRPGGRGRKLQASPVKLMALANDIPVYQPESLKSTQVQSSLAKLQADIMVVAAYGLILPVEVLLIPPLGCVNIHASLLPRWRGAAPIQRAILAGDRETGITIMQMDAGLDSGDILKQTRCTIYAEDTAQSLHSRLADLGAQTLISTLSELAKQKITPQPQDESHASYAQKLQKSEAVLDWRLSAQTLENCVRAFNPWPVAYTMLDSKTLRIWRAQALDVAQRKVQPGTVIKVAKQGIDVACNNGVLKLKTVQLAGAKSMEVDVFLNGHPNLVCPGIQLGNPIT